MSVHHALIPCLRGRNAPADVHSVRAADAEILAEPKDNDDCPGRGRDARDTGGNVWNFGSYDPFGAASHR